MLGFKTFVNARVVIAGIEFVEKIKKQHYDLIRIGGMQASHAEMWQRTALVAPVRPTSLFARKPAFLIASFIACTASSCAGETMRKNPPKEPKSGKSLLGITCTEGKGVKRRPLLPGPIPASPWASLPFASDSRSLAIPITLGHNQKATAASPPTSLIAFWRIVIGFRGDWYCTSQDERSDRFRENRHRERGKFVRTI
jgi:hypothetical protein